jgi:flavin reductase (DIM6/NTAB) family NADH-FMN oxidoreductase RutF
MKEFIRVDVEGLKKNVFTLLNKDWMLISAGKGEGFNAMTASWGGFGVLWNHDVAFIFVRPTRYSFEILEKEKGFALSFFSEKYRSALDYCGSHSGREGRKIESAGLTTRVLESGMTVLEEASFCLSCRTLYSKDLDPDRFIDPSIIKHYPIRDFHRMYVGEIVECLADRESAPLFGASGGSI